MFKRVTMLLLVLMLAFSPAVTFAAESTSSDDDSNNEERVAKSADNDEKAAEDDEQADDEKAAEDEKAEDEKGDDGEEEENADGDAKADVDSVGDEESGDEDDAATEEDDQDSGEEADESSDAVKDEDNEDEDKETADEEEQNEVSLLAQDETDDEDLDLTNIRGTASGDIKFDFDQGNYVLELKAGLNNFSSDQVLVNKWVAFALPEGVSATDLPVGTASVILDGHQGIAAKVPDVGEFPDSQYTDYEISLTGEIDKDYNDPNEKLYMLNVDPNEETFENLGQLSSQRDIDFSVMDENPELDMEGYVTGEASYNADDRVYDLNVESKLTNNTGRDLENKYVGFKLPDDIQVSSKAGDDIEVLSADDGGKIVALKFSSVDKRDNYEDFTIPVLGKTDGEVSDTDLILYNIDENYNVIGTIDGSADIDYSAMDKTWDFNADAEIYNDYPDLNDNQIGFKLLFDIQNLTIDEDFDQVKVEFQTPDDDFKVIEPDNYVGSGNLDIDWDGNTAIVDLDSIDSASGVEAWFEGFAETSKTAEQLAGTEVTVTMFADGEQIKEVAVPFSLESYDGQGGLEDPEEDPKPDPKPDPDPDPEPEDPDNGDNGNNKGDDKDDNGDNTGDNNGNNNGGTDGNDNNDGTNGGIGVDNNNNNHNGPSISNDGDTLPKTGTFFGAWFWQLLGALMLISGGLVVFRSRKVRA